MKSSSSTLQTVLVTIATGLVVAIVAVLAIAYSGVVNVGATNAPLRPLEWFLSTTREHSVAAHASLITAPSLESAKMRKVGAEHFQEMCVSCHGAPGVSPTEAALGLEPPAPKLYEGPSVKDDEAREMFWIVKNGIQMTGMPSFGKTHDDQKIWAIIAFVKQMRGMSPEQYKKVADSVGKDAKDDNG